MLVNAQEWGVFVIFWRADDVTRTMSKGGACECLDPPPLQEILYPRLCMHACVRIRGVKNNNTWAQSRPGPAMNSH